MKNQDVRKFAKEHGVFLWQVADVLGISEPTLTRRFRKELCNDERERVLDAIRKLAAENGKGADDHD